MLEALHGRGNSHCRLFQQGEQDKLEQLLGVVVRRSHFTSRQTAAQRGTVTCPRSPSKLVLT